MKNKILFGICIIAVSLIISACPEEPAQEAFDTRLIGSWTNRETGVIEKTFTVKADHTFSCSIDPGNQGRATVTGKLTYDGNGVFAMSSLTGSGAPWTESISLAIGDKNRIRITFTDTDTFKFASAQGNTAVTDFFGGIYYRVAE